MTDDQYVQRPRATTLRVFISPDYREGDLEEVEPCIGITDTQQSFLVMLTWREARDLAKAIKEVEGVSRCG